MAMSTNARIEGYLVDRTIVSGYNILFFYEDISSGEKSRKIKMMPHFISPVLSIIPSDKFELARAEFFFNTHSTKDDYIVYITQVIDKNNEMQFDFYKTNGTHVYSKKYSVEGLESIYGSIDLKISPNGRYIFIKVKSRENVNRNEDNKEDTQNKRKKSKKENREYFEINDGLQDGVVYEIVMLRRSSTSRKIDKSIQNFKLQNKERININDIKPKLENEEVIFDLKVVRVFKNINKYFGNSIPSITSIGTLADIFYDGNMNSNKLLYEEYDVSNFIEGKLGYDEETYEKFKISDFNWKVLPPGFIGFKKDRAVFVKVNVDISKQEEMIHNPITGKGEIAEIMNVNPKPSKILHIDFILRNLDMELVNVYE